MSWRNLSALALMSALFLPAGPAAAQLSGCERGDFVAVVEEAAGLLRDLNHEQRPRFQERLRELKDKKGWSHDQFMAEAVPFVQDEKISGYDARSAELLDRINRLGESGGAAPKLDCGVLIDLRGYMKALVDIQKEKWDYMFGKLDGALRG